MCPVKLWASIFTRILSFKGTNQDSPVSLAQHRDNTISITSEMVANLLKYGIVAIGEAKLGIHRSEVGTHVPRRSSHLFHNADRPLVEPRFPDIHPKTNARIQFQHLIENDQGADIQTHQ